MKPHKIKDHRIVKSPSFSQIVNILYNYFKAPANDSKESKIIDISDKNDEESDHKHDNNSEYRF